MGNLPPLEDYLTHDSHLDVEELGFEISGSISRMDHSLGHRLAIYEVVEARELLYVHLTEAVQKRFTFFLTRPISLPLFENSGQFIRKHNVELGTPFFNGCE